MGTGRNAPKDPQGALGTVVSRLSPKALIALIALGLFLTAGILAVAVVRGSAVNLFFVQIEPRSPLAAPAKAAPMHVRLNLEFDPNEVNARAPGLTVRGFVKAIDGREQPLSLRHGIDVGSMYVEAELPDITTPIFVEVQTPRGVWKTDDFSLAQSRVRAFRIRSEP
jgi:hypothetical protein